MEPVTITELNVTCSMSPSQLEGKLSNGYTIYSRSRFSGFSVEITEEGEQSPCFIIQGNLSHDKYACMSVEHLKKITQLFVEVIDW